MKIEIERERERQIEIEIETETEIETEIEIWTVRDRYRYRHGYKHGYKYRYRFRYLYKYAYTLYHTYIELLRLIRVPSSFGKARWEHWSSGAKAKIRRSISRRASRFSWRVRDFHGDLGDLCKPQTSIGALGEIEAYWGFGLWGLL